MKPQISWYRMCLLVVLCGWPALRAHAQSSEEEAGDISEVDKDRMGPLRERVRPVSGHLFLKQGRFELSPGIGLSTRDAFYSKLVLGGALTYFPVEWLGISLQGGYSLPGVSGAAQICRSDVNGRLTGCESPTDADMDRSAPGKILLLGGLDLQWAPIYGKVSLFADYFLSFDMYAIGGVTAVQYRGSAGDAMAVGGNVGVGMRFVLTRWLALRTELRDIIYAEDFGAKSYLRNQLMVNLGLSLLLPFDFKEAQP